MTEKFYNDVIKNFTPGISSAELKRINAQQNLWHIFSFEKAVAFEGKEANAEFAKQNKKNLLQVYEGKNQYPTQLDDKFKVVTDDYHKILNSLVDFYIFPPDLSWIFVLTHEVGYIGPFFAYRQK